jgi:hypothetical protein
MSDMFLPTQFRVQPRTNRRSETGRQGEKMSHPENCQSEADTRDSAHVRTPTRERSPRRSPVSGATRAQPSIDLTLRDRQVPSYWRSLVTQVVHRCEARAGLGENVHIRTSLHETGSSWNRRSGTPTDRNTTRQTREQVAREPLILYTHGESTIGIRTWQDKYERVTVARRVRASPGLFPEGPQGPEDSQGSQGSQGHGPARPRIQRIR